MNRTLLVTGGAGFIGANFVRWVLRQDAELRVLVLDKLSYAGNLINIEEALRSGRCEFMQADIADERAVAELFERRRPWAVVNFAAESHVDRSIDSPAAFIHSNIVGAFTLLEQARRFFKSLPEQARRDFRFVQISTDEVYGSLGSEGRFREETPYAPNSPYSASKAAADHLARAYWQTYGLPVLVTNCSNNYGPYQFPEKLIPLMILNALEAKPLPIYGDGGHVRDWLHVEDHCAGVWAALVRGRPGEKYNFGGGGERTNLQVVRRLCEELERLKPARENPAMKAKGLSSYTELISFVTDRPGHDRRYAIDASKAKAELGWAPARDFETGIAQTVRWYVENLDWCAKVQAGKYGRERLGTA